MKLTLRSIPLCLPLVYLLATQSGVAQNAALAAVPLPAQTISLPTFTKSYTVGGANYTYTLIGSDPAKGGTTTIPTVLVPITLKIEAPMNTSGKKAVLDAGAVANKVLSSPIFTKYAFAAGTTQYVDAMMRTDFYNEGGSGDWHTLLGRPTVIPIKIDIPVANGYVLTSKKTGRMLAMLDVRYIQQEIFKQLPKDAIAGKLVIAVTRDVTYYTSADATECCSSGTHGVDTSAGGRQPFVLGSYLDENTEEVDTDVQPLSQQLEQFARDPLHDPLFHEARGAGSPGNTFPSWTRVPAKTEAEQPRQNSGSGGSGLVVGLFLNDPTDTNWKNTVPASTPFVATVAGMQYHLQNVALLQWYNQTASPTSLHGAYSFPDAKALLEPAKPAPTRRRGGGNATFGTATAAPPTVVQPVAMTGGPNGHKLIGYWSGLGSIRDVSPQWDIILVAFANAIPDAPVGRLGYTVRGIKPEQFKADIKYKQSQGKKVMISLRNVTGGNPHIETEEGKRNFIKSVEDVCTEFGFDGIDIDFESRWGDLLPGDTDFKHPTSPSTVNLIAAMREIHDHFGPEFMLSLVPEGTQTSAAGAGYGGQFGSYIPIIEGLRDILSFSDTQDYNCPPIQGLDGEFYMPGSVDYHAAATEQLLHGFDVGRDPKHHFDALPASKVIIGYMNSDTTPEIVADSMRYLITGKSNTPVKYKLRSLTGYPAFSGAMFWTIDADHREGYRFSNLVGPVLHSYPAASAAAIAKPTTAVAQ